MPCKARIVVEAGVIALKTENIITRLPLWRVIAARRSLKSKSCLAAATCTVSPNSQRLDSPTQQTPAAYAVLPCTKAWKSVWTPSLTVTFANQNIVKKDMKRQADPACWAQSGHAIAATCYCRTLLPLRKSQYMLSSCSLLMLSYDFIVRSLQVHSCLLSTSKATRPPEIPAFLDVLVSLIEAIWVTSTSFPDSNGYGWEGEMSWGGFLV